MSANKLYFLARIGLFRAGHWVGYNPMANCAVFSFSGLLLALATYQNGFIFGYTAGWSITFLCFLFTLTLRRMLFSNYVPRGTWQSIKHFVMAMLKVLGAKRMFTYAPLGLLVAFSVIVGIEYATSGVNYINLLLAGDVDTIYSIHAFAVSLFKFYGAYAGLGVLLGINMLVLTVPKYKHA